MGKIHDLMEQYRDLDFQLEEVKAVYKTYNDKIAEKKKEVNHLQKRSAEIQHEIGSYMVENGVLEEDFGNVTIAPKKLPDLVHVDDLERLPTKLIEEKTTTKKTADKTLIKAAIKSGEKVEGAYLIENRYAIRFKNVKIS